MEVEGRIVRQRHLDAARRLLTNLLRDRRKKRIARDEVVLFDGVEEGAHAFGDDLVRKLFKNFLANRVVDFGQRGEVEILAHQLDERAPLVRQQRFDQVAYLGLVEPPHIETLPLQ